MTTTKTRLQVRTTTKNIHDLTAKQFAECSALTLVGIGSYGLMHGKMRALRSGTDRDREGWATTLRDDTGTMVGWVLTFKDPYAYHDDYISYFFVHPSMRRQGVGTRLYRAARRRFGIVRTEAWDDRSRGFFRSVEGT